MEDYKKTFSFIDKENHKAKIEVEISHRNGYPEFSVCANYCGGGGQCLDNIKPRTSEQGQIIGLWKDYHLKDISKLPANVQFLPSFEGHLSGLIEAIEREQSERDQEEEKKEKTDDEKLLAKMEEQGIDENMQEACKAYLECMNIEDLDDFEESYSGEFSDDETFAREQADNLGAIDENLQWPNNCIDWEDASRQLMMDYTDQDGFYFRNI